MTELIIHGGDAPTKSEESVAGEPWSHRRVPDAETALAEVSRAAVQEAVLCRADLAATALSLLPEERDAYDLIHAGLRLGAHGLFRSPSLASLNWFLLDPDPSARCTSWKATTALCWLRPGTLSALGGWDAAYRSPDARLMDFAYRLMMAGGRICHDPAWAPPTASRHPALELPLEDEFIFICRHMGAREAAYAAFWRAIEDGPRVWRALTNAVERTRRIPPPRPVTGSEIAFRLMGRSRRQQVTTVSAIIPTINRYDYLPGAIESLLRQEPAPCEVIVVDQTPVASRRPELYEPYRERGVRVHYLERAGQSSARNAAIAAAVGDWCLLFDDDQEAWDGMLAAHIDAVEYSGARISTGIALAPWKTVEQIPERLRHPRAADVLATGNALVQRSALHAVGGLDDAYNYGSGADDDLGVRLFRSGCESVFNPKAIMTHFKAPAGGLREFGAWWRNRTTLWAPFPPPTQVYAIQQRYPRTAWWAHYLRFYLNAGHQHTPLGAAWLWLALPWKLGRAISRARRLTSTRERESARA